MKTLLVATLLSLGLPHLATGGELSDLIMAPGLFVDAGAPDKQGEILRYAHSRHLPGGEPAGADTGIALPEPVTDGRAVLSRNPQEEKLALSLSADGTPLHVVAEFPVDGPNPILLMFLENAVRNMTVQTGGSPHYIRNRIRESLAASGQGAAVEGLAVAELHPFRDDPNRSRMGDFGELKLTITYDPDEPARLVELMADTGTGQGGYTESMSLIEEE